MGKPDKKTIEVGSYKEWTRVYEMAQTEMGKAKPSDKIKWHETCKNLCNDYPEFSAMRSRGILPKFKLI